MRRQSSALSNSLALLKTVLIGDRSRRVVRDPAVDSILVDIAEAVVEANTAACRQRDGIRTVRASTRHELYGRLCRGRDFVEGHLSDPILTVEIARAAGLAEAHFHRHFMSVLGETPHRYLTRRRLERACDVMKRYRERPLHDIAAHVGFQSVPAFVKAFRRSFGLSPGRFRSAEP